MQRFFVLSFRGDSPALEAGGLTWPLPDSSHVGFWEEYLETLNSFKL